MRQLLPIRILLALVFVGGGRLAFALERTYYGTKKRLRLEPVNGGLLSPASNAGDAANHLKVLGHEVLEALLTALGGPMLLPYARRTPTVQGHWRDVTTARLH